MSLGATTAGDGSILVIEGCSGCDYLEDRVRQLEERNRELEAMIQRHAREAAERESAIRKLCLDGIWPLPRRLK